MVESRDDRKGEKTDMTEKTGIFEIRTDLALEEKESFPGDGGEIHGVSLKEWQDKEGNFKITEVIVLDEEGAQAMGKPVGTYMTLEAKNLKWREQEYHTELAKELARQIARLMKKQHIREEGDILVVGLGNEAVTPDSLGPMVVSQLRISRHLKKKYRQEMFGSSRSVSALVPGVMAQTGMETAEIIRGVVQETKPDMVLVIDALAARSVRRLGNTIQLSDTGIAPGSGVGNHRSAITEEVLGVPVLAVGVPTVVGAAAIAHDTVGALIQVLHREQITENIGQYIENMDPEEQYAFIREILDPELGNRYVTEPDIDETIRQLGALISDGIHRAVYPEDEEE